MSELQEKIDEIKSQRKNQQWNYFKTTASPVDFVNYMKSIGVSDNLGCFQVSTSDDLVVESIINWLKSEFDSNGLPNYTMDNSYDKFLTKPVPVEKPKYWFIFFK